LKKILRLTTAGSVDDGKSTLIGRLFLDERLIKTDILEALGDVEQNLAELTDGLREEREKKITIDVAFRYFEKNETKFIIADSPGHQEFLRSYLSALTQVDAVLILIDAAVGISEQTLRHLNLATFLGIQHICIVVNKMDLVKYSHDRFRALVNQIDPTGVWSHTPASALHGDNVTHPGPHMPWYNGPTLMQWLESIKLEEVSNKNIHSDVQLNLPDGTSLAFLNSGELQCGERFSCLDGRKGVINNLFRFGKKVEKISAPGSFSLIASIPLFRGDILLDEQASEGQVIFKLKWCYTGNSKLGENQLILKHHTLEIPFKIIGLTLENDIHECAIETPYSLFLNQDMNLKVSIIDDQTKQTVGLGFLSKR